MKVQHMVDWGDLIVVNAARVSFEKESWWEDVCRCGQTEPTQGWPCTHGGCDFEHKLKDGDARLINFLAREGHWLPFRHPHVRFRCSAPIFVARQAMKHQVGMTWSEVSRRYVDSEPEFYIPNIWRKRAPNKKQGSLEEGIRFGQLFGGLVKVHHMLTTGLYSLALKIGISPEQARMVLPQSMEVQWVWTGSLLSWAHFVKQRTDSHAQKEIRDFACQFAPILSELYPVSWGALMEHYEP